MSYLQAMIQKKVKKEELSRGIQVKIDKLHETLEKISEFENEGDLDDEEQEQLEKLKKGAEALDSDIEKSVLKFDPVKYKKQLEVIMVMREKKKNVASKTKEPEPEQEEDEDDEVVERSIEKLKKTAEIVPDDLELCEDCEEDFKSGRLTLSEIEEAKRNREFDEEEEFEKVSNAKPRKLSTSVIVMGIGAFILTWGAVNFFRERSG